MYQVTRVWFLPALLALSGCANTAPEVASREVNVGFGLSPAPEGADPGTCWARDASPAVVETVTEHVLVQPEIRGADGQVIQAAIYHTETRQAIVKAREDTVFQTPCSEAITPEFVASLQRALSARRLYHGLITGTMDGLTRAAVRRYQKPFGLDSGILSLESARMLGLVAQERTGGTG